MVCTRSQVSRYGFPFLFDFLAHLQRQLHHRNINVRHLVKVFSCWLLGKSKRSGDASGGTAENSNADNQIFNSAGNSINHIDLEADMDLNL